jgi:hypothetical protein
MEARFSIFCGKIYKINFENGIIFENDLKKLNVKDKTSESPLFESM